MKKLYLCETSDSQDTKYWVVYESLEQMYDSEGSVSKVYEANPKLLGSLKAEIEIQKKVKNKRG